MEDDLLNESIDIVNFLKRLKENITHDCVKNPKDENMLVEIREGCNKIIGITIKNKILYLSDAWDDDGDAKYILKANEYIYSNTNNEYVHEAFSFDFRGAESDSSIKKFRIDYKSKGEYSGVHAHDYNYDVTKAHLRYPDETNLKIHYADINSILVMLDKYIRSPEQYPLSGDEKICAMYNKIIENERKKYDERV